MIRRIINMKFFVKNKALFSCLSFVLIGAIMIACSIYSIKVTNSYDGAGIATVNNIVESQEWVSDGDGQTLETVYTQYVTYEVDGVKYENIEFGTCDKSTKIGDEIEIVYDTKDPSKFTSKSHKSSIIVIVAGSVSILVGIIMFLKMLIA